MDVATLKRRSPSQDEVEIKRARSDVDVRQETFTIKAGSRKSPLS